MEPSVVIIVMGAAGAGKTTIGRALAGATGWRFLDADDLHPPASIEKMSRGEPLTDHDRGPWLDAVRRSIEAAIHRQEPTVVACSALKKKYRDYLTDGHDGIRFVYLKADARLLRERLSDRQGHFAGPALVNSQLASLEEPDGALTLDASQPADAIVGRIREAFGI